MKPSRRRTDAVVGYVGKNFYLRRKLWDIEQV